jgi:hypothetical protein
MKPKQDSLGCIKCHMPELTGGAEKMDKRARGDHASHKFLGIYDKKFRATGLDIHISTSKNRIEIKLTNKMGHPLIVQPARAKYLVVKVFREGKEIWRNYKTNPKEDKEVFFEYRFKNREGEKIIIPAHAYSGEATNLDAKESKTIKYSIDLQKGDTIKATMFVRFAKQDCKSVITLKDTLFKKEQILKEITITVK